MGICRRYVKKTNLVLNSHAVKLQNYKDNETFARHKKVIEISVLYENVIKYGDYKIKQK